MLHDDSGLRSPWNAPSLPISKKDPLMFFMNWVLCCQSWILPYPKISSSLGCGYNSISNRESIELFFWLFNDILTISNFLEFTFSDVSAENWLITSSCRATHSVEEAEVLRSSAWHAYDLINTWASIYRWNLVQASIDYFVLLQFSTRPRRKPLSFRKQ